MNPPSGRRQRFALRASDPQWLRLGRIGSVIFLVAGCLIISAWQADLVAKRETLDRSFALDTRFTGFVPDWALRYFYFEYYTGLYPVASLGPAKEFVWNEAGARRLLEDEPRLVNEYVLYLRTGDLARIYLLYPGAWWEGSPRDATLIPFNFLLGAGALLALFVSFSFQQHRLLGSLLVALLGSHPMVLAELFMNQVLGYAIPCASLLLAINAPILLGQQRSRWTFVLPVVSGIALASIREVRSEPAMVGAAVAAGYLLVPHSWRRRAVLVLLLVLAFGTTGRLWAAHWDRSFDEARRAVEAGGGTPFTGPWNKHHVLWHSLWCGLGDFDTRHGYEWDDRVAFQYGIPEVNRRFGTSYEIADNEKWLRQVHAEARYHQIRPETLPEYNTVIRDKVLSDIASDPLWYAGILTRRAIRLLSQTTPIRLGASGAVVDLPFSGWLLLPALVALAALRSWDQLAVLGFFLSTSLTPLLVYSGWNLAYASSYHLALFSLAACWLANGLSDTFKRRRTSSGDRSGAVSS